MVQPRQSGFTLIELMVVVVVAVILATMATSGFGALVSNNRQVSAYNTLVAAIRFTRGEAIKRRGTVSICKSSTGTSCATSGGWESGWMVFLDDDGDGEVDSGDAILKAFSSPGAEPAITGTDGAADRLTYNSLGFSTNSGTLRFCDSRGARHASAVLISAHGRPRKATDIDSDGLMEDGAGADISCP